MKLSASDSLFLIGSFGASAVLIYGAPAADLSQPRNLVLSATIGVTIHLCMGEFQILASPIAVALAMVGMQLTRTEHPPGGATALIAVTGGSSIQAQAYAYVISPVLFGSLILLLTALFLNNLSPNRAMHYPVYWW